MINEKLERKYLQLLILVSRCLIMKTYSYNVRIFSHNCTLLRKVNGDSGADKHGGIKWSSLISPIIGQVMTMDILVGNTEDGIGAGITALPTLWASSSHRPQLMDISPNKMSINF